LGKGGCHSLGPLFLYDVCFIKPGATYAQVEPKARMLVQKYAPATYKTFQQQVVMQPMADWHLYTEFKNGYPSGG